jgi:hypothetical protein
VTETLEADKQAIAAIIDQMFDAISWNEASGPDLERFSQPVLADATIIPSARPAVPTRIDGFAQRMGALHEAGAMKIFEERALRSSVQVFGNIAVALGGYEMKVDGGGPSKGANAFLFIREAGGWRIAGMAWDSERDGVILPADLDTASQA